MSDDQVKNLELFNAHQEDSRKRTEFLAKSVFLISGTALTLSVNLFLGKDAPLLTSDLATLLRSAWLALFVSILGYVFVMSVMLIRDYRFGECWRKSINGHQTDVSGTPGYLDTLMWVLGVVSILGLVYGIGALAWVSSSLIGLK
jgi:hypothetical protein